MDADPLHPWKNSLIPSPPLLPAHKEEYHSQDTDQDYDYGDTDENGRCSESRRQDRREIVQTAATNLPAILAKNRGYK